MRLGTPFRRSGPRLCRGGVVLLSLLGYLAAVVGYPLPTLVQKSDQPFPCQHHACGCADAQQCWRGCCCFTPQQKLAWARENHVTPPADAELAIDEPQPAGHDDHDDRDHSGGRRQAAVAGRARHSCCASHSAGSGIRPAAAESAGRTRGKEPLSGTRSCAANSPAHAGALRFISGDAWRRCRGLPTVWVSTGAALPPPAAVGWQFSWDVIEWLSIPTSALYGGCLAPPVPPPRV